jgi:hypothetical protein
MAIAKRWKIAILNRVDTWGGSLQVLRWGIITTPIVVVVVVVVVTGGRPRTLDGGVKIIKRGYLCCLR